MPLTPPRMGRRGPQEHTATAEGHQAPGGPLPSPPAPEGSVLRGGFRHSSGEPLWEKLGRGKISRSEEVLTASANRIPYTGVVTLNFKMFTALPPPAFNS